MWSEKYRPVRTRDMVGNEAARLRLLQWLGAWTPKAKPLLLLGPPGTGKTTLVQVAARELGYTLLAFNASDERSRAALEAKVGHALQNVGLFRERLLIFFDEVDYVLGREDYGGADYIADVAEARVHPVVMAANVEDAAAVEKLAKAAEVVPLKPVPPRLVELYLRHMLAEEGMRAADAVVQEAARLSRGDLRAALNTLQALVSLPTGAGPAPRGEAQLTLREAIERFARAESPEEAHHVLRNCVVHDTREKVRAFYFGLVAAGLEPENMAAVLDQLTVLDQLVYRAEVRGDYYLRRYMDALLVQGLFWARRRLTYQEYEPLPWGVKLRLWNEARVFRSLAAKVARVYPVSVRACLRDYVPYMALLHRADAGFAEAAARIFGLEEAEIKLLGKQAGGSAAADRRE